MNLCALRATILFALSLGLCIESHAAQFIPLGDLPGGEIPLSSATAISSNGMFVVGESTTSGLDDDSPYIWSESTGLIPLGTPPGRFSTPNAVTDDGEFVVGTHRIEGAITFEQAFVWSSSTGMIPLTGLSTEASHTEANDVTPEGAVVVGMTSVGANGTFQFEAYRKDSAGEIELLGDLPGGQHSSSAHAVSANGAVIVGETRSAQGREAFVWTENSGMTGLGDFFPPRYFDSIATKVSEDGFAVTGYAFFSPGPRVDAFRWTANDGLQLLGSIPDFSVGSFAKGISGDGSVIVGHAQGDSTTPEPGSNVAAFVWDSLHGMRNLQNVLRDDFGLAAQLEGWRLYEATDISADGRSIIGLGRNPDRNIEAWLVRLDRPLTAPEPGTLIRTALASSLVLSCRRNRR